MKSTSSAKILVLEDDVVVNLDYCLLFEDMGYETRSCHRIAEASEAIEKEEIGFALVDHRLEGRTSEELRGRLRQLDIPFIIVSGSPEEEFSSSDRRHLHQKPIPRETIEEVMKGFGRPKRRKRVASGSHSRKHTAQA